jgi:hypothetical protein
MGTAETCKVELFDIIDEVLVGAPPAVAAAVVLGTFALEDDVPLVVDAEEAELSLGR